MRQCPAMHVHAAELRTSRKGWHGLTGVHQRRRIKGRLQAVKLLELGLVELYAHLIELFHANTVLAGHRPADIHAKLQDLTAERFRALLLAWLVGVIQNERMQISIARVEHVGDGEAKTLGH